MAMRANYWSCSKLANIIRGVDKPSSETSKGWRDWKSLAKTTYPLRFWIAEEALDKVQDIVYSPVDLINSVRYYINNRWITKTHTLTSNLKPGQWYDLDTRILNCVFDELVNYVEIELAYTNIRWSKKEERKKYDVPFWARPGLFRIRTWRSPQAGLDYIAWASELRWGNDDWIEPDHPDYGKLTLQATSARELGVLYNWWKNVRPNRPDIYDASGWSELCDKRREAHDGDAWLDEDEKTPEERIETKDALDRCHDLEEQYENEDTEMLKRLIDIRRSLWT